MRDGEGAGVLQEADEHGGGGGRHHVHHHVGDQEAHQKAWGDRGLEMWMDAVWCMLDKLLGPGLCEGTEREEEEEDG